MQGDNGAIAVDVCRGVRQGCVLSPLLYILVVARLHEQLRQTFGDGADQVLDYYADDTIFYDTFRSRQELHASMEKAEKLLEVLAQAGLNINDEKTQVLLKLGGSQAKKVTMTSLKFIKAASTFVWPLCGSSASSPYVKKPNILGHRFPMTASRTLQCIIG